MQETIKLRKFLIEFIDQVFEIEKKVEKLNAENSINRNVNRLKMLLEEFEPDGGLFYQNPIGEPFNETRTDVEASIAGASTENLIITEVIKPIIRHKKGGITFIVRKGVVVVESLKY